MDNNLIFYLAIAVGALALIFALAKSSQIGKLSSGDDRMKELAGYIHDGAMAFLSREYKSLTIFVLVVAIILGIFINIKTAIVFIFGALFLF